MANLSVALIEARTLLNERESTPRIWTDTVLLRHVPKAHRELQLKLLANSIAVIREYTAAINITALDTTLGGNQPSDLIEPIAMEERAQGSSDKFNDVREVDFIPNNDDPPNTLTFWTWREEIISFAAPSTNREIRLKYRKGLTIPTATGNAIGVLLGEMYLGPRIAALAAFSVGNLSLAEQATIDAEKWIDEIVSVNIKGEQSKPIQRIPYRRRRRR